MSTSLRDVVEAALRGRDDRLVAKCDVLGILAVFERCDIYDVPTLAANMDSSFAELRKELEPVAAQSFLALLKATVAASLRQSSPSTPSSAPPTAPQPPFCPSPLHPPSPPITAVPLVITIKMNGKVLCERTTLPVPPTATWESVARTRLEAVLDAAEVQAYMSMPLAISLFPTATHSPSDCVRAAVSDTVAGAFMLGYPHVLVQRDEPWDGSGKMNHGGTIWMPSRCHIGGFPQPGLNRQQSVCRTLRRPSHVSVQ
jgi:hypothetical protein